MDNITNKLKENPFELVQLTTVHLNDKSNECRTFKGMMFTKSESKEIEVHVSKPDWYEDDNKDWMKFE